MPRSARTSACGLPARSCQPSPMIASPRVTTQPTRGFGVVVYKPRSASESARRIIAWSKALKEVTESLFSSPPRRLHFLDGIAEIVRRLELPVDRSEADVGDLVELGELAHHEVAHPRGGHLALAERAQPLDHAIDRAFDLIGRHRALAQREHHAAHELLAIEVGAAAVLLHEARHLEVHPLVGGEALLAARALAPPARGVRLKVRPRVDDLGFLGAAEGAFHGSGWLALRACKPLSTQCRQVYLRRQGCPVARETSCTHTRLRMRAIVLLATVALSAGCSSSPTTDPTNAFELDSARMAVIDRQAARLGTRVYWVNPPRKAAETAKP